ncbi:hypothetical protein C4D60_Mb00t19220 [Musa balbisiana]|uniref:50S ribosomal protein L16, chloroplastic n=1 Tax=Musa balbisiana TaxID=52838 RepID=A0A4S8I5P6_MUSBA|nr:hypothetical protein C4D60_Mb00t19220 [Musa balbisiana]
MNHFHCEELEEKKKLSVRFCSRDGIKKRPSTITKRTRFRKKKHRGRMKEYLVGAIVICFGRYALQALEPAWITARQIEAGRRAMKRYARRGGKIWLRNSDKPVTVRPAETVWVRGRGSPIWVSVVKPGRILYEMGGVSEAVAKAAISLAASKMPIRTQFVRIADNSGARELMCIRIIGAVIIDMLNGDVIVAVIKEAVPNMPLERSEIIRAVIVRTCKELKRDNGMIIRYDDNAAVVIDQEGNPKGTRFLVAMSD